jgi:hypothetical protein
MVTAILGHAPIQPSAFAIETAPVHRAQQLHAVIFEVEN